MNLFRTPRRHYHGLWRDNLTHCAQLLLQQRQGFRNFDQDQCRCGRQRCQAVKELDIAVVQRIQAQVLTRGLLTQPGVTDMPQRTGVQCAG